MKIHPDFKELLEAFAAEGAELVVVGAYASPFTQTRAPSTAIKIAST